MEQEVTLFFIKLHPAAIGAIISSLLMGFVLIILLSIIVFLSREMKVFYLFFFVLAIFLLLLGYGLYISSTEYHSLKFWMSICYTGVSMAPLAFYIFINDIINKKNNAILFAIIIFTMISILLIWFNDNLIFTNIPRFLELKGHYTLKKGILFIPYVVISIITVFYSFIRLCYYNAQNILLRKRNFPLIVGFGFWVLTGFHDTLVAVDVFDHQPVPWMGPIPIVIMMIMYLIKHNYEYSESISSFRAEISLAQKIQQYNVPHELPEYDSMKIYALYHPMYAIGGDFYDFHTIDNKRLGILIADVSGHGISAAIVTFMIKVAFEVTREFAHEPLLLMTKLNQILSDKLLTLFITAQYVYIDLEKMQLKTVRAGHPYAMLWDSKNRDLQMLKHQGGMITYLENVSRTEKTVDLNPGDKIFIYTDGIFEVTNEMKELFAISRLKKVIIDNISLPGDELMEVIKKSLNDWAGRSNVYSDDVTMLIVEV